MDPLIIMALIALFIIILYAVSPLIAPKKLRCKGAHILVTGGSIGIGRCIAIEAAKRGANVTLLARNQDRLVEAKKHVEKHLKDKDKQKVVCVSVDLAKDYATVERTIKQAEEQQGPVDILINNAGISVSARFEDTPIEDFKRLMDTNYIGGVYATRAVFSGMKQRQRGRVVFVSSQAGQLGLFGYSAYSPTKFALRGLAEALQMEAKPYNIRIGLAFPPDTLTDSYIEENETKPKETKLISETSGLFHPDVVAKTIVDDAEHGRFLSYMGLDGYMLASLTCGMAPIVSIMEATQQVVTMGIFRVVALFYLDFFDRTVQECKNERDKRSQPQVNQEASGSGDPHPHAE